jgi:hypothetical protein
MLTDVGFNQAFLSGVNQRMLYPNFFKNIEVSQVNLNARFIERTKDTAFTFVDGLFGNFRNFKASQFKNKWSWPYFYTQGSKLRYCWKRNLWSRVSKLYNHKKFQSHFIGEYKITLSGLAKASDWEDKTYELCPPIEQKLRNFASRPEVMKMDMVKYFKKQLAKNPQMVKAYEQAGIPLSKFAYKDIKGFSDWCVATNTDGRAHCPANVWRAVQDMYDFKFYGILNYKDNEVCAATFGRAFVKVLRDFGKDPKGNTEKLHLWVKSDTLIGRFYTLLGIIPKKELYLTKFRENETKLNLARRPLFADNLTTEISEKENGELVVRVIRNGIAQSICTESKTGKNFDIFGSKIQ